MNDVIDARTLLTTSQAARKLRITPDRLRQMARAGQAAPFPLGGESFYTPAEVDRLKSRNRKPGRPPKVKEKPLPQN